MTNYECPRVCYCQEVPCWSSVTTSAPEEQGDAPDEGNEVSGFRVGVRGSGDELVGGDCLEVSEGSLVIRGSGMGAVAVFPPGEWLSAVKTTWKEY